MSDQVTRLAEALVRLGVEEGDRVAIFLPMSQEVAIASHACAHIGAIQVPIFSGFAAPAVAQRLQASEAKVAITTRRAPRGAGARCRCWRSSRRPRAESPSVEHVVLAPWDELVADLPGELPAAELPSETPYLLTYTSGTTGKPKGVVHVQGGFLVSIAREVCYQADAGPDDVIHFATDMGWIMGPWTVVGGQAMGSTLVFAEGAPDWPPDRLWRLIEQERVSILGISPTLVRALIPHGDPEADLSSLRTIVTTGEPWNPEPYRWLFEEVGGRRVPIINCSGGHRGRRLLPLPDTGDPDQGLLARRAGARDGDGRRRRRGPLAGRARRGRRARLPQALPGDDARVLARSRALPRDVLEPVSGRLDARRLGVGGRGRLLVPPRPVRRHAQHRGEADRPGGAGVGGGRAPVRAGGGGGRHPARGQRRSGMDLLHRGAGSRRRRRACARGVGARRRAISARRSGPTASCS